MTYLRRRPSLTLQVLDPPGLGDRLCEMLVAVCDLYLHLYHCSSNIRGGANSQ